MIRVLDSREELVRRIAEIEAEQKKVARLLDERETTPVWRMIRRHRLFVKASRCHALAHLGLEELQVGWSRRMEEKWRSQGLFPCWRCGLPVSVNEPSYCPTCVINGHPTGRNLDETVDKPN